jgi:DNA-binding NarL/FixJ family response regulator
MSDRAPQPGQKSARVLIVDDHPVVREGLGIRIARYRDLEVCGEASTLVGALTQVDLTDPDVAIIDISLGDADGIDLIRRIRSRGARARMLVWSMYPETLYAERALHAGAMGYVNKQEPTGRIIEAIRCVLEGRLYLSESMTSRMLVHSVAGRPPANSSPFDSLSDRELAAFRLIGKGLTTAEVADAMSLSMHTVETYRQRIKAKLKLRTGAELAQASAQWVLENG